MDDANSFVAAHVAWLHVAFRVASVPMQLTVEVSILEGEFDMARMAYLPHKAAEVVLMMTSL